MVNADETNPNEERLDRIRTERENMLARRGFLSADDPVYRDALEHNTFGLGGAGLQGVQGFDVDRKDLTAAASLEFNDEELITAVFDLIDTSGNGTLDRAEFQEWFEYSDLVGLMAFKEFYTPIKAMDKDGDGDTNSSEFVFCMNYFRVHSSLEMVCLSSMSWHFGIIFIIASLIYVCNEISLGEQVHTTTDFSWRFLEVLVWTGFLFGMIGYLRMYVLSIERECTDNRDKILAFRRAILAEKNIEEDVLAGTQLEDEFRQDKDVFADTLNPLQMGKGIVSGGASVGVGLVGTGGAVLEKSAMVTAKITDGVLGVVGVKSKPLTTVVQTGADLTKTGLGTILEVVHVPTNEQSDELAGQQIQADPYGSMRGSMRGEKRNESMRMNESMRGGGGEMNNSMVGGANSSMRGGGAGAMNSSMRGGGFNANASVRTIGPGDDDKGEKSFVPLLPGQPHAEPEPAESEKGGQGQARGGILGGPTTTTASDLREQSPSKTEAAEAELQKMRDRARQKKKKNNKLVQLIDLEVEEIWMEGGMTNFKEFSSFWETYCQRLTRFYDEHGARYASSDWNMAMIERKAKEVSKQRARENTSWVLFSRNVLKNTKGIRRIGRAGFSALPGGTEALELVGMGKEAEYTDREQALRTEILLPCLIEAVTTLKEDYTKVGKLAKSRPGYWLTLLGIFGMVGRSTNAIYQFAQNQPIDPSGTLLVVCIGLSFLGQVGSLLVFLQVISSELRMWEKIRELLLKGVLADNIDGMGDLGGGKKNGSGDAPAEGSHKTRIEDDFSSEIELRSSCSIDSSSSSRRHYNRSEPIPSWWFTDLFQRNGNKNETRTNPYYFSESVDSVLIDIKTERELNNQANGRNLREGHHTAPGGGSMRGAPVNDDSDDDQNQIKQNNPSINQSFMKLSFKKLPGTSSAKGKKQSKDPELEELSPEDAHRRLMLLNSLKRDQSKVYHIVDEKGIPVWIDDQMHYWLERTRRRLATKRGEHIGSKEPVVEYARGYREDELPFNEEVGERAAKRGQEKRTTIENVRKARRMHLSDHAQAIFTMLDEDESGHISKEEIMDFVERMGPSRVEMGSEIEAMFSRYDEDDEGTLDLQEFTQLLKDLDSLTAPGAARKRMFKSPVYWAGVSVVVAGFCSFLSAFLTMLMGGTKDYSDDNGVVPFAMTRTVWKLVDYPKAIFLLLRASVIFAHQMRFFVMDAQRYEAIFSSLQRDGHMFLVQKELALRKAIRDELELCTNDVTYIPKTKEVLAVTSEQTVKLRYAAQRQQQEDEARERMEMYEIDQSKRGTLRG